MISENLAKLFSNLSRDNVSYFSDNWTDIIKNKDIKENFLSYCLEEKAFNVFNFAVDKGLRDLRSIVLANAIRKDDNKTISLIIDNHLFKYDDKKASDLLSISINNNDIKVINFLLDKVTISEDILHYALAGHNKEYLTKFNDLGFQWRYLNPEENPIIYIMENYKVEKSEYINIILQNCPQAEKIINEAKLYFEDTEESSILNAILDARK